MPHVRALGSLAYVYKERAQTSSGVVKEGAAILPDPEFSRYVAGYSHPTVSSRSQLTSCERYCRKAADALDKAASLIPNDHPDRPIILYHALSRYARLAILAGLPRACLDLLSSSSALTFLAFKSPSCRRPQDLRDFRPCCSCRVGYGYAREDL